MANSGNIILGVSVDEQSIRSAENRIRGLIKGNQAINLKVNTTGLGRISSDVAQFSKSLESAQARTLAFVSATTLLYGVGTAVKSIASAFIETEARFKSIQIVLNTTTQKFDKFKSSLFDIARNTGKSFEEAASAAEELARQGLKVEEVQNRVNAALILSRQSGLGTAEAVKALTAATNSFNKSALDQIGIVNKLANVDANFAVSSKDLVESLSRAGATAQDAGISFEKLLSLTASLQQTTARGGAVIGNALRSIFTRIERGSTLDALQQFGVATRDLQGNVLAVDQVLKNLANTYKTLSQAEQAALSEKVAGIQQINQLKALLSDLSKGNSIYAQSLAVSTEETNSAIERNKALNQTLQTNLNAIKTTATQFSSVFGKLVFQPTIKGGADFAQNVLGSLNNQDQDSKSAGQKLAEGFLSGFGKALAGPGAVIGISAIVNVVKQLGKFSFSVLSDYAALNSASKSQGSIQNAINQILATGNGKYIERLARARSIKEEELAIKSIMLEINALQVQQGARNFSAVQNIARNRGGVTPEGSFKIPRASGGFLPVNQEQNDINRGVGGASRSARPKVIPNFNFGGGKRGTVVANTDEYIVPNFGGSDGSAIFNQQMVARHGLPSNARKINASGGLIPNYNEFKGYPEFKTPKIGRGGYSGMVGIDWKSVLRYISPNQFLESALPLDSRIRDEKSISNIRNRIQKGQEIDPGYLRLERDRKSRRGITGHEGRHRATAALLEGVQDFPVEFDIKDFGRAPSLYQDGKIEEILAQKYYPEATMTGNLSGFDNKVRPVQFNFRRGGNRLLSQFSRGLIPNYFNKYNKQEANYNGALIDKDYKYIYADQNEAISKSKRLAARAKGFELLNPDDVNFLARNEEILKGHKLKIIDPTAQLTKNGTGSFLNILSANSFKGDKYNEARLLKLGKVSPLAGFLKSRGISNQNFLKAKKAIAQKFGNNFFIKAKEGGGSNFEESNEVFSSNKGISKLKDIDPEQYYIQEGIKNTTGLEYRVNLAGVGKGAQVLGRGAYIKDEYKEVDPNLSDAPSSLISAVKSGRIEDYLKSQIAIRQAKQVLLNAPERVRRGSITGFDVLETNKSGLGLLGQYLGIGKGGGVVEANFSQDDQGKGQAGYSGYLDKLGVLIPAAQALIKNNGGFAGGLIPNFNLSNSLLNAGVGLDDKAKLLAQILGGSNSPLKTAINREKNAGIPLDQIKVENHPSLVSGANPGGLAVTNKIDEPGGISQGISRAIKEGRNPKTYGASKGLIPNYALPKPPTLLSGAPAALQEEFLQELLREFAKKAALENQKGFFSGRKSGKILKDFEQELKASPGFARLGQASQDRFDLETSNVQAAQADRRRGKVQGAAFTAAIGAPILTNALTSLSPANDKTSRQINAVGESAGTGLSLAATFGFSPFGIAVGAATTALGSLRGIADASRKSLEDLTKEVDDTRGTFEGNKNASAGVFQGREQLKDLINSGASSKEIDLVSRNIQDLITSIDDPSLRNKVVGAKTNDEQLNILAEISSAQAKAVAEKGIGVGLESIIGKNRDIFKDKFGDTQNILLNKQDRTDVTSLIRSALPLESDATKRTGQIKGLEDLNTKGDFGLESLQRVLGTLNISSDALKQFNQLALIEQELIVKNVVQRNLSADALRKENENLKVYTQSVVNLGRLLDKLQTSTNFKFDLGNIRDSGTRNRALSGANQALGTLGNFITPESQNRFENRNKEFEIKNELITSTNDISKSFINSFDSLPSLVEEAFKKFTTGNGEGEGKNISGKSESLKNTLQQLRANVLAAGGNPVDAANSGVEKINEQIKLLGGQDGKLNKPLIDALIKFRDEGLSIPVELARAQSEEARLLQANTNKLNELNLSITKQLSFLGGRSFKDLPSADFSDIKGGLSQGKTIRDSINGPFSKRIFKSRGSSFQDFFQGQQIDEEAENSRRGNVFSKLAGGKLQAFKEGFLDGNPEQINQARFEVAKAYEARQTETLDKLIKDAQNSGDFEFADQLRSKKTGVSGNAALLAAKDIPFDQKNLNTPFGPEGAFKELSASLTGLKTSFDAGITGNFNLLFDNSKTAASALLDLAKATKEVSDINAVAAKNIEMVALNEQKKELEGKKLGLLQSQTAKDEENKSFFQQLDKTAPSKSLFGRRLDEKAVGAELGIDPQQIRRFNDFGQQYANQKDSKFTDYSRNVGGLGFNEQQLGSLYDKQFQPDQNHFKNPELEKLQRDAVDRDKRKTLNYVYSTNQQLGNTPNNQSEIKKLQDQIDELQRQLDEKNKPENKAAGYIPKYAGGLISSLKAEQKAISSGVGGARAGDKPYLTQIKGLGPAVVNTGESIIRNFAGGGDAVLNRKMKKSLGINNYADGNIDLSKLSEKDIRYGDNIVANDELSRLAAAYKKDGIEGVKRCIAILNSGNENLVANKAGGYFGDEEIDKFYQESLRIKGVNRFDKNRFQNYTNRERKNNFGGSKIFGDDFNNQSNIFNSQFAGSSQYKGIDIQERIRNQGSAFSPVSIQSSGGLRSGSLQGPQRYGSRELNSDEIERDARRNSGRNQNRYDRNVGRATNEVDSLKKELEDLRNKVGQQNNNTTNNSQNSVNNSEKNGPIDVSHTIKIEINGNITAKTDAQTAVINEELANFKTRVEARLASLEAATPGAKPVPPIANRGAS
jgi:TP901 family phage tail tape measure protein